MPRPPRCRRICGVPQVDTFCPNGCENTEPILLTLDEYEVIRLVDLEQQTHEQCAAQMDISRSTVQEIYESARSKIAAYLVHGKPLHITGGNYRICRGQEAAHCGRCCRMQRANMEKSGKTCKGDSIMKIAVAYENGQIFQHFGHTEQFKLYEAVDGKITHAKVVDTNGSGHGALAGFLMQHGVDTLVYGGIGGALGMTIGDIFDPVYVVYAPKTFLLKLCIGLITGLIAHKCGKITHISDKKKIFQWTLFAAIGGLAFNMVADPLVGYFYKLLILGKPAADITLAWNIASTSINAVLSTIVAVAVYMALRPALQKAGLFFKIGKTDEAK